MNEQKREKMRFIGLSLIILWSGISSAETLHIAVASNFYATLKQVGVQFTQKTHIPIQLSTGGTGVLYAQIKQGAPFDIFFAADKKRPKLLEKEKLIAPHSRLTYAIGQLVVWAPHPQRVSADLSQLKLNQPNFHFLAIANPKTAPYGVAGLSVLKHYGLVQPLVKAHKLIKGENIGKTFGYAVSGNAQIALVAKSYLVNPKRPQLGQFVVVNPKLYAPILQQLVVLKGKNTKQVQAFLTYFKSPQVQKILASYGYGNGADH